MMLRNVLSSLIAVVSLAALAPTQADAAAKQKAPDPEVIEKLAKLSKEVVKDVKMEHDADGVQLIDVLLNRLDAGNMGDKDKQAFAKGLEGVLTEGKLREPDKMQLYIAAAAALGKLGADGAKVLHAAWENKRFPNKKDWVPLREALLKNLGKTKDESMVKFLCKEAQNPEPALQAEAGEALGNFDASDQKIRKEVVSDLLVKWGTIVSRATPIDPADMEAQNARERLAVISEKWNTTLGKLTKQGFHKFEEWQTWNNKNKGTDWK
ncbi:MAG TPA: hypothetical protein VK348_00630 [Planctomycetota bacterium]|nr:hypothetical protein [Planctomycetota bacterium]